MAVSLKHAFTSNVADSGDPNLVQPSNWNAEHTLTAGADTLLGAISAGSVVEIPCTAAGRAILDDADAAAQRTTLGLGTGDSPTFTGLTLSGVGSFSAGTALLPSITTTGDLNTGMWFPAADTIAFSTGGSEHVRITSTGNFGIGTSNPSAKIDIVPGTAAVPFRCRSRSDTNLILYQFTDAAASAAWAAITVTSTYFNFNSTSGFIGFNTNSTERMRIDSSGNVGIGTSSPDAKLSINGIASFGAGAAATPSIAAFGDLNTGMWFPAADTVAWSTGGSERMRVTSVGKVLMGGTSAVNDAFSGGGGVRLLQLIGSSASLGTHRNDNTAFSNALIFTKARGTAFEAVADGDTLGIISFQGANGSAYNFAAEMRCIVNGVVSGGGANDMPGALTFSTTPDGSGTVSECMRMDAKGNVIVNTAAVATNATDGFLYVPSCAGTPTGVPTTYTGRVPIVVDTTNNKLYFYSGGAWRDAGP